VFLSFRSRSIAIFVVAAACVAVGVLLVLLSHAPTAAAPLPRGSAVTVPDRPPALDASAVLARLNKIRKEAGLPALTESACLDAVAGSAAPRDPYASSSAAPSLSTAGCRADVRTGWASGTDPSGVQMVAAALTREPSGPSPLLGRSARAMGLALVPQHDGSSLTGYALCWAVAP
jgi:hypothetical protein